MGKGSLFIAIEGLDGSGKTTIARELVYFLQSVLTKNVKLTFEPHDPSCGGLYIRQVLEKKIIDFSHETLMMAFAANRLDHCDREINKWLSKSDDRIVICDRYYLSSLVYQSNEEFSFDDVMEVNSRARKPDLTIFMNVSNEVCYERMKVRNKKKELFETNLGESRDKYFKAIDYLREKRNETIEIVSANGTMKEVLAEMVQTIAAFGSAERKKQLSVIETYEIPKSNVFALHPTLPKKMDSIIDNTFKIVQNETPVTENVKEKILLHLKNIFTDLDHDDRGVLFCNYIESLGYELIEKLPWTHLDAYELKYELPGGLNQRGLALLVNEHQRYDVILEAVSNLHKMTDFMFVFSPGPSALVTNYYEREIVKNKNDEASLFPSTQLITEDKLLAVLYESVLDKLTSTQFV